MTKAVSSEVHLDRSRYLRVVRYFAGAFARLILWEIVLRSLLGRRFVSRSAPRRWRRIAQSYRQLAVELGGVLIKLGQFLSIRVDVLPREITSELAGLQDEVPAEQPADIQAVLEEDYGQPLERVFAWFASEPQAAASLAQVHRARLLTGDEVVVKVQRPRMEMLVETDLQAIRTAIRWLKRYPPVRRRVDVDRLYEEFARTTRQELDFVSEGENAERFAQDFYDDAGVRIPRIYATTSTRRVLVMEDVTGIKITDFEAIEAAGIDRGDVARRLFDAYLRQLFVHNFLHADPHPGNLFVRPLSRIAGLQRVPGEGHGSLAGEWQGRPFQLVFVDFGMVATVPERMRKHFRDLLIGFATRDAARMVRAYQGAGVLLPGADLARLEQVEAELVERYWGLTLGQAQELVTNEWQNLALEYRDILYEMPFQLPTDLLFVGRALAVLFGMASSLDPDFDPWKSIAPFAEQVAEEETRRNWRELLAELQHVAGLGLSLPGQADRFFGQATRGELAVRTTWTPEASRTIRRVEVAVNRLASAVVFAALLVTGAVFSSSSGMEVLGYLFFGLAGLALLAALFRR
jgi:predicted unusual protein kinase regulating ubiquinone biosynthesis (AarF/ABC1/UbiB family)